MKKSFLKFKNVLFFAMSLSFFMVGNAGAQQNSQSPHDGSLQISPLRYDWSVNTGDEKQGKIIVKNNDTEPINVETDIEDFSVGRNLQVTQDFFVPNESHPLKAYDVINWIDIDKSAFRLESGESKEISFIARVPSSAPTGGYNGVIFFTKKPVVVEGDAPVKIDVIYRLGVLVRFGVRGSEPILEKGELELFEPVKKIFFDNPIGFNINVTNSGNFPYKVSGAVDIFKGSKKITTLEIAPNFLYVDRTRGLGGIFAWKTTLLDIGKYEAKVHLVSEDGNVIMDGNTSFLILPWRLIAGLLVTFVILAVIFLAGMVSGKKKKK